MKRLIAAVVVLACPATAIADVVYHAPRFTRVGKALKREVRDAVRARLDTAGHVLGKKRAAQILLVTQVRRAGKKYALTVRVRRKQEKKAKVFKGHAVAAQVVSTLSDLLDRAFPPAPVPKPVAKREDDPPPPAATAPRPAEPAPTPPAAPAPAAKPASQWPPLHPVPATLAPFPEPVDPPPEVGALPE